ncbi:hypothetical protein Bca4012_037583 [Brassica carinata]
MVEKVCRKWSFALLRMECDKIGAAPYDGCLRTFDGGIKPFVVCLGVKILMTCFPARPLWSSCMLCRDYGHVVADGILCEYRGRGTSCHLVI